MTFYGSLFAAIKQCRMIIVVDLDNIELPELESDMHPGINRNVSRYFVVRFFVPIRLRIKRSLAPFPLNQLVAVREASDVACRQGRTSLALIPETLSRAR